VSAPPQPPPVAVNLNMSGEEAFLARARLSQPPPAPPSSQPSKLLCLLVYHLYFIQVTLEEEMVRPKPRK